MKQVSGYKHRSHIVLLDPLSQTLHDSRYVIHVQAQLADACVTLADRQQIAQFWIVLDEPKKTVRANGADRFKQRIAHGTVQNAVKVFFKGVAKHERGTSMAAS